MKKSLSLILALVLLFGLLPMTAFASETVDRGSCGAEVLWTLDADGTLTITGNGEMTTWSDENSVPWSAYRDQIKKVTIDEGVTTIGDYAFKSCTNLADVTIPASVVTIKSRVFYGCSSLSSIDFPDGIITIEEKAFKECNGLTSVILPANLATLGHGAFSNCSNLRSVVIPASVTSIKDYAFYACSKLSEVVFLGDAPSLKSSVFYAVKATVYYPCTNNTWTSSNMLNYGGTITWKAMHNSSTSTAVTAPTCTEKGYTTYTCECGDSYVDDYVDATGHSYLNGTCTTCGAHTAAWDTDGDGVLEFIAIGNSFTVDALTYAYEIAENLGVENIVIGQLTIGGSGLSDHAANATGDLAKYRYRCNVNGDLSDTASHDYKISTALEERSWDYIIIQQRYYYSGVESTYNEDLTNLVAYLKERSDAKLVWHMTWAIQQDVVDDMYNNDQMTMYNAIVSCVKNKIATNSDFDRIIPSGTALQNSRTSELGDTDTRDGYHMSYGYGRYLTGLMFIKTITGLSIDGITYAPSSVDAQKMAIAIESVNNAYSTPFAVTDSKYAHTHSYTSAVTAPTCTEQGYTTYSCACGDSYVDDHVDATGHSFANGVCSACGHTNGPVITQQPTNGEAKLGERYMVEVKAEGEGLKYQWYFRNAGSSVWYKSSVKDNTYDDVMTKARAGREVYCVITDANGNSVTTEIAKLICTPSVALEIVTQPTNGEAVLGERYCVTVEAKGDGLKYQWYFRNAGSTTWYKSSVTDNTYDDVMTTARAGREVYCAITDAYGNSVKTDVVKLIRIPVKLEIISQPTDATAAFDEMFCATVEAKGEGLKYQWYFRNAGSDTWHKSGVRDNTYDDIMTKARAGREIYCVITDAYGNTVTTDIVKLIAVPKVELKLLGQTYESAAMGERYCVTVEAQGEGLTYQWYFRNAGSNTWYKSSVKDNTYDDVMTKARANREVYCVITDAFGNQVITEVITLELSK